MPVYSYTCPHAHHWTAYHIVEERALEACPTCHQMGEIVFWTPQTAPAIQSAWVDNHVYNGGQGYYDEGLGAHVRSRAHRDALMKAKGLTEVSRHDRDLFERPQGKSVNVEANKRLMKDCLDEAQARLRSGTLPPPTPTPEQTAHVMPTGYDTVTGETPSTTTP